MSFFREVSPDIYDQSISVFDLSLVREVLAFLTNSFKHFRVGGVFRVQDLTSSKKTS